MMDLRTLNVGDTFVIEQGSWKRTMRVTVRNGDKITAVWAPSPEERAQWDGIGWAYAEETWL